MPRNNIAETLRNYANRDDVDVVFKCVLAEAAATIESLQKENENYVTMIAKLTLGEGKIKCE
ncbi:MAG: hypothetical protein IIZ78_16140 [Clostridiales bacterium]|nr:hypothetical protein [Clostridiales bacterium]